LVKGDTVRTELAVAGLAVFMAASPCAAEEDLSFGFGMGALYAGLGANLGLRSDDGFAYVGAGCVSLAYGSRDGWALPCGVGAGWIRTDLFGSGDRRHGLGIYVGPIGAEDGDSDGHDRATRYGLGLTYAHFFSGVTATGWSAGVTPAIGRWDGGIKGTLLINAGYQF
jgi:hypothetical protein